MAKVLFFCFILSLLYACTSIYLIVIFKSVISSRSSICDSYNFIIHKHTKHTHAHNHTHTYMHTQTVSRTQPVIPAPDAALEDEDLPGEDPVPLLLQVEVMGVLQEHLTYNKNSLSMSIKNIIKLSVDTTHIKSYQSNNNQLFYTYTIGILKCPYI